MKSYTVNFWGSHPDNQADDCWTGKDFSTEEEAIAFMSNPSGNANIPSTEYFELCIVEDGAETPIDVIKNSLFAPTEDNCSDWQKEIAMQNGMTFGCQGYNDTFGY